jgi:hypothetical protein
MKSAPQGTLRLYVASGWGIGWSVYLLSWVISENGVLWDFGVGLFLFYLLLYISLGVLAFRNRHSKTEPLWTAPFAAATGFTGFLFTFVYILSFILVASVANFRQPKSEPKAQTLHSEGHAPPTAEDE